MGRPRRAAKGQPGQKGRSRRTGVVAKAKSKGYIALTKERGESCGEYGELVFVVEPGPHGEEGQVHGGGGRQEGRARDEHATTEDKQRQAQPPNVGSELTEDTAIEVHLHISTVQPIHQTAAADLAESTDKTQQASEEVEDQHGVGLEHPGAKVVCR